MAELVKQWNDGESFTVTYDGDRDGSAVVVSGANDGIDREQTITVQTTFGDNPKRAQVRVKQFGMREVFNVAEGAFMVAEGSFNVLK